MTCIVGLVHKDTVYMGCDSEVSDEWERRTTQNDKVFYVQSRFIIGTCGSIRMRQILEAHLDVKKQPLRTSDYDYLIHDFIEGVRYCLSEFGYTKIENNREEAGDFLVGYRGKLYHVWNDFQLDRYVENYDAAGSGRMYAIGVLASQSPSMSPQNRILKALKVSAKFAIGVSAPFVLKTLN